MTEHGTVGPCPSDELLAAFVERSIAVHRRADVERHVADCPTCLDVVAASLTPAADVDVTRVDSGGSVWAETPTPPRPWRSWAIAASLLLSLGASVFVMRERYLGEPMAPAMARLGARMLGLSLQAGDMDLRLGAELGTFVIALKDVTIGRVGRRYHADEIGMTLALAAPLTGEWSVQYVHVTRPTLDLVGRDPKDILVSPSERGRALELLGQANRVDVEDARLLLAGPDGTPFAVDGIAGGIERTPSGAKLAFRGRAAGGELDLVGTVSGDDRDVTLTIGGRDLVAGELPLLRAGLRGTVELRLDVRNAGGDVRVDGRVAIRAGQLLGRGPAALASLSAESRAALAARDGAFAGADLPFDDARAMFAWRNGTWRLQRLYLATLGAVAGGRARIAGNGAVSGHGTVRLPAEIVADLEPHEPTLGGFRDTGGTATLPLTVGGSIASPEIVVRRP
jgi:hypothetical protein